MPQRGRRLTDGRIAGRRRCIRREGGRRGSTGSSNGPTDAAVVAAKRRDPAVRRRGRDIAPRLRTYAPANMKRK